MFDLYLMTLNITAGKETLDLPGLLVTTPPKRCDRSRSGDLLVARCSFSGTNPPPEEQVQKILRETAGVYYDSRGSVTASLKIACEDLNGMLFDSNLKGASRGIQRVATLTLAVIRRDALYLAQSGQTAIFLVSGDEVQAFNDPNPENRGLGISKNPLIQLHQFQLHQKDLLLFSPNPPVYWNVGMLAGTTQTSFDQLRRRLVISPVADLQAVILQFQVGRGEIHRLRPRISAAQSVGVPEKPAAPARKPPASASPAQPPPPSWASLPVEPAPSSAAGSAAESKSERPPSIKPADPAPAGTASFVPPRHPPVEELVNPTSFQSDRVLHKPVSSGSVDREQSGAVSAAEKDQARHLQPAGSSEGPAARRGIPRPGDQRIQPSPRPSQPAAPSPLRKALARLWFSGKNSRKKLQSQTGAFAGRLLPTNQQPGNLSFSSLVFIAVAVPVVIAAIATTIYARSGWKEQHFLYLQEAQKAASQAMEQKDPILQANLWKQSQDLVEKAEKYGQTEESRTLHLQAQQAVDRTEGVQRLELIPTLAAPFSRDVSIRDIVVSDNGDLYLLNGSTGSIIRLFATARGYEVDPTFSCGPGNIGTLQVGPLVDLVSLDFSNKYGASILASDSHGSLLYCTPGKEPVSRPLPGVGGAGWSNITAIARDSQMDSLYVADTDRKLVVYFDGDQSTYDLEPHNAFDNYIPIGLDQAVDIAFNEDLFILYANSRLAWCTQRNYTYATVECNDPAAFGDSRPNRASDLAIFPNARFTKVLASSPPDPALYMIEQNESSLYLFSLKLNLQYLLRPQVSEPNSVKKPLSAFAIAPGRVGILAFGNEIYSASLP